MEAREFNIETYLKEKREKINSVLERYFPKPQGYGKRVIEAARYSLFAGGKRIRPILCIAGAEIVGGRDEDVIIFAAGLECLHTYSLIHDDLPAMDDDDFRRGKPTCHKAFDEATAILAGDGLQALAFSFFTHPELVRRVDSKRLVKAIHLVSEAVGLKGMVGGQMADLIMEGKRGNLKILRWIHTHKTVKFIEVSVVSGALLGGGNKEELKALSEYGRNLGMVFQMVDDLLDIVGDEKILGKKTMSDAKKKKLTYPSLVGIEKTKELAQTHTKQAILALEKFKERGETLRHLAEFLLTRIY